MKKLTILNQLKNGNYLVEYNIDNEMVWEKETTKLELLASISEYKVYAEDDFVTYSVEICEEEDENGNSIYDVYTNKWTYTEDKCIYSDEEGCKTYKTRKGAEKYALKLQNKLYKDEVLNIGKCNINYTPQ